MFFGLNSTGSNHQRGIREVCNEALNVLLIESGRTYGNIRIDRIDGYFREILSILDEQEDDRR